MLLSADFNQTFNIDTSIFRVHCEGGGRETVFLLSGHDQKIHLYKEVKTALVCVYARFPVLVDIFSK